MMWHRRLGHLNITNLLQTTQKGFIKGVDLEQPTEKFLWDVCFKGKMTFPKISEREMTLLELIHTDVCGPMRIQSNGKAKSYVTFIDDHSKCCEVRFISSKKNQGIVLCDV